jgi:hypothetical protein
MPPMKGFDFKNRNLEGFFPGKRSPKPFFTAVVKAAA